MKQAAQQAGGVVMMPTVPTRERPDKQNVVGLKDDELAFPGDILVMLTDPKGHKGGRLSVRPAPAGKCPCNGYGWGVVAQPDGGRFTIRVPELCSCVMKVVVKVCGAEARVASWTPPPDDDRMLRWRAACDKREEQAGAALAELTAAREAQAAAAEAEAEKLEARVTDPEVTAAQAVAQAALRTARDAVAVAAGEVRQAEALLAEARAAEQRAAKQLSAVEVTVGQATAAGGPGAEVIAQLRATAAILRGPASTYAERIKVATADLKRVQREVAAAQRSCHAPLTVTP